MPLYDFECLSCLRVEERYFPLHEKPSFLSCVCGGQMRQVFSPPRLNLDYEPWVDENLGEEPVLVKSRSHHKELLRQRGLEISGKEVNRKQFRERVMDFHASQKYKEAMQERRERGF